MNIEMLSFLPSFSLVWTLTGGVEGGRQTVLGHDGMVEEVGHRTLHPAKDGCDKLNLALQIEQILNKITFFFPGGEFVEMSAGKFYLLQMTQLGNFNT